MIRAVILDDEMPNVENLQWKLNRYCPEVKIDAFFTDPVEAISYLRSHSVDLLFLDIEMPLMTGFDVLEELRQEATFDVIFVTAHPTFGIKAIKYSALDYILKPVHNAELIAAVEKHKSRKVGEPAPVVQAQAETEKKTKPVKIALASKESIEFVSPDDIVLCEADSNYTNVYLVDGTRRVISRTLKDFENTLLPLGFFRPHLSYVIHLAHVREFQRGDGGYIIMANQKEVPVSKNKKAELLELLGG